jgi:hypothetical protein
LLCKNYLKEQRGLSWTPALLLGVQNFGTWWVQGIYMISPNKIPGSELS